MLDPEPPASGVRRTDALGRFLKLSDPPGAIRVFLSDAGARGVDAMALVRRAGLGAAEARDVLAAEIASGRGCAAGTRVFDRVAADGMEQAILASVSAFHASQPLEAGMPREALREQVAGRAAPELFDTLLADLETRGLVRAGERVAKADHVPVRSPEETRLREVVLATVRAGGLTPPDMAALAAATRMPPG